MPAPWLTNKWQNGGTHYCAYCSEPDADHKGDDDQMYCDAFCEEQATPKLVRRARKLS